jgi:four helix bundle protein
MNKDDLRRRTKAFALRVLKLIRALPKDVGSRAVASQLVRSAMSVGANYRASLRGRSRAEWLSKSEYWMELIVEDEMLPSERVNSLLQEAAELTAIFAASIKTGRESK